MREFVKRVNEGDPREVSEFAALPNQVNLGGRLATSSKAFVTQCIPTAGMLRDCRLPCALGNGSILCVG